LAGKYSAKSLSEDSPKLEVSVTWAPETVFPLGRITMILAVHVVSSFLQEIPVDKRRILVKNSAERIIFVIDRDLLTPKIEKSFRVPQ
jgi:hypothetical protein